MTSAILLSLLSGAMFAVAGIAYRVGMIGNVQANQCGVGLSVIGFIGFGLLGWQEWQYLDWRLMLILTVTGVTQYLVMLLLRYALKTGPLSPAWCAVSLMGRPFMAAIIIVSSHCSAGRSHSKYFVKQALSKAELWATLMIFGSVIHPHIWLGSRSVKSSTSTGPSSHA